MSPDTRKLTADAGRHSVALAALSEEIPVGAGITRRMLSHGPDLMLCRVSFARGAAGELHSHPHSQITYVESGRFRFLIAGTSTDAAAGDSCYVGPDVPHTVECIETGVLIDAFTPSRQDFLSTGMPT